MAAPKPRGSDVMASMKAAPGAPQMNMSMLNPVNAPQVKLGSGVQMIAPMPADRTGEPGQGAGQRRASGPDLTATSPPWSPTPTAARRNGPSRST